MSKKEIPPIQKEEMISALNRSGYFLESRVEQQLQNAGFQQIYPNAAYEDQDTGKSREIDLTASFHLSHQNPNIVVNIHLLIECKKLRSPFIFFEKGVNALLDLGNESLSIGAHPNTMGRKQKAGVPQVSLSFNGWI